MSFNATSYLLGCLYAFTDNLTLDLVVIERLIKTLPLYLHCFNQGRRLFFNSLPDSPDVMDNQLTMRRVIHNNHKADKIRNQLTNSHEQRCNRLSPAAV